MHKPHNSKGFRPQDEASTYQFDYEHRYSSIFLFDGETINRFNPTEDHQGYTLYFLARHVYDPSRLSYKDRQRLDLFQIKQAKLVPETLTAEQEEALAASESERNAGQYNSAIRRIATHESDTRLNLLDRFFDLKMELSAGLGEDAIENIRSLKRSGPFVARLQEAIEKFDALKIGGNDEEEPLTESK
jgi:hypothetical protein